MADAFTQSCQNSSGPKAHARTKEVLDSLMKHLHAFCRETQLTQDEWLLACNELARAGQMSDAKRNELILISDVLGIESLVDSMAHERAAAAAAAPVTDGAPAESAPTLSAILGPFYRENAPKYPNGSDVVLDHSITDTNGKPGITASISGTVSDASGKPIVGAEIDVWFAGPNGLYEQQDPKQPAYNYRGLFTTDAQGAYSMRVLKPTAYPIPFDGPTGDILRALDRSPMRPAHIHFLVKAPGHKTLITQLYDRDCEHVAADAVFAVKDSLVVDFRPAAADASHGAATELRYDIVLAAAA
ncbi:aromatic compound dioxygenase [Tilletiopsis washingtonensis]|uniref:Aromatic compound dioxygenase n=1 Tax=Tilletiopsis washingtonensis TaxID=58919 RepID=A0A316Z930_9BASI|nr:aromatic compound dioxygenase [Tilletiopsis washingtonensis]PWN98290.1 aromatic compound dioxygenase [Tilletiopsis washingtonensis]